MAICFRINAEHLMTGTCVIYKVMTLLDTIYFDWQEKYSNWWFQNCGNHSHQTLGKHSWIRDFLSCKACRHSLLLRQHRASSCEPGAMESRLDLNSSSICLGDIVGYLLPRLRDWACLHRHRARSQILTVRSLEW